MTFTFSFLTRGKISVPSYYVYIVGIWSLVEIVVNIVCRGHLWFLSNAGEYVRHAQSVYIKAILFLWLLGCIWSVEVIVLIFVGVVFQKIVIIACELRWYNDYSLGCDKMMIICSLSQILKSLSDIWSDGCSATVRPSPKEVGMYD